MNISSQFVKIRIPVRSTNCNWFIYFLYLLFSKIYLFSLPSLSLSSSLHPSLSLPLTISLLKKTVVFLFQGHFHVTFSSSQLPELCKQQKTLKTSTPPHQLRQNKFLINFSASGLFSSSHLRYSRLRVQPLRGLHLCHGLGSTLSLQKLSAFESVFWEKGFI